ncbi:MAG: Fic family protein [Planctomycetia bacterium]
MVQAWTEQAEELREKNLYKTFLAKLRRQWAIETGVIEGLYTLSEGATLALIEKGLDAALISHGDTDQSPEEVVDKIQDQHRAIQGLYQFVSGERDLGVSYIKELHQELTAHQPTYVGRDTLGNLVERALPRGEWKKLPNNVEHPDGSRFEYCPPEHVQQEMENLLSMHESHDQQGVPPDVEAAWLHHRFTLIHPFTDGNGRVARCLATLVFLKANWLPLVVTRKERVEYIASLRTADGGDLSGLVDLFGNLQRRAIREALSLTEEVIQQASAIDEILADVKAKFSQRRAAHSQIVQRAYDTSDSLQKLAFLRLEEIAAEITQAISIDHPGYKAFGFEGVWGTEKSNHHYHQIIECARSLDYFANLRRYQAWAAMGIVTGRRAEILFSFHGIGHEESGILGCSAMFYIRDGDGLIGPVSPLATEPFEFSYGEDSSDVQRRFRKWLDSCVIAGLDCWRNSL